MNWKNSVILATRGTELFSMALLQFIFLFFGENRQYPLIVNDKR